MTLDEFYRAVSETDGVYRELLSSVVFVVPDVLVVNLEILTTGVAREEWFDVLKDFAISGSNHHPKLIPARAEIFRRNVLRIETTHISFPYLCLIYDDRVVWFVNFQVGAAITKFVVRDGALDHEAAHEPRDRQVLP